MNTTHCRQHDDRSALSFFFLKLLLAILFVLPIGLPISAEAGGLHPALISKVFPDDGSISDSFGFTVSNSGDTAIIGASGSNSAYIFEPDSSGTWMQKQKLLVDDGSASSFGRSVSISGDTAVIGASGSSSAYIFERDSSGTWMQQAKLLADDGSADDNFGYSVSISGDTLVIGALGSNSAYIFERDSSGTWMQQEKLLADDGSAGNFGWSVSISGDTAVIGAFGSNSAYIFERDSSGTWMQQETLLPDGSGVDVLFGYSVSISGDTAVIGARLGREDGNNFDTTGSAYIFERNSSGTWMQQAKLLADDRTSSANFGYSVSISGDIGVIGAREDSSRLSYIFDLTVPNVAPTAQDDAIGPINNAAKIIIDVLTNDCDPESHLDVSSVKIGTMPTNGTAVVDRVTGQITYTHDGSDTHVDSFTYMVNDDDTAVSNMATVTIEIPTLAPIAVNDFIGSVEVGGITLIDVLANDSDSDGLLDSTSVTIDTAPINGMLTIDPTTGQITYNHNGSDSISDSFTYTVDDNDAAVSNVATVTLTPLNINKLLADDGSRNDQFGLSVSISGDTAVIGAQLDDDNGSASGSAYIFERDSSGAWMQQAKLLADDSSAGDQFGVSVSISGDTAVIGAFFGDGNVVNSGSAYIFERDSSGTWMQQAKLLADDGNKLDQFGNSVTISGDIMVIGASGDDDNGSDSGSAYIFERDSSGTWVQQTKLLADDAAATDNFGYSVSISGDTVVIGAYFDDDKGTNSGSAYIFERDSSGSWMQQAKLLANDGSSFDSFGRSVSISGDTAVIGAYLDDDNGSDSGSAYIFGRDNSGTWMQQAKLLADDGSSRNQFGFSVSISGDTVVIGTEINFVGGFSLATQSDASIIGTLESDDNGSAYIFVRDCCENWIQQAKLQAEDGAVDDQFGISVSISGDIAVIAAVKDDDNGFDSGSAYIFDLSPNTAPTAENDTVGPINNAADITIDVLMNDSDNDGSLDMTSVTIGTAPTNGNAVVDSVTGEITYTHNGSATTSDSFTYTVEDNEGEVSNQATVTLIINEIIIPNGAPIAQDDTVGPINNAAEITIDVLTNDSDRDGSLDMTSVTIGTAPTNGIAVIDLVTGQIIYTHDGSATTSDRFTYTVEDNEGLISNEATVSVTINEDNSGTSDLIAHWPIDEGTGAVVEDIENDHDGSLINGPVWAGNDLLFDGDDDYIEVGIIDVPGEMLTLTAWAQSDNLENCFFHDCRILSKASGNGTQQHYWMLSTLKVGTATRLRFRLKAGGTTSTLIASSGDISNGELFHAAAVYDGTTMRLYKNGVEVGSLAKTGQIDSNNAVNVWIGSNPTVASSRPWEGSIADVRIYQKALTVTEVNTVKDDYDTGSDDLTPPVIDNVEVVVTDTTAVITWDTNEPADSTVDYGLDNTYGTLESNGSFVTTHSITLLGLAVDTEYHYQLISADINSNSSTRTGLVFTTLSTTDSTPPEVSNIQVAVTNTVAVITWK